MKLIPAGKMLITIVAAYAAFGSYVFDWNKTHIYNPDWPPHAKFHNAQTMLLAKYSKEEIKKIRNLLYMIGELDYKIFKNKKGNLEVAKLE